MQKGLGPRSQSITLLFLGSSSSILSCPFVLSNPSIYRQVLVDTMAESQAEQCPVDHKAREKWLEAAKANGKPATSPHAPPSPPVSRPPLKYSLDAGSWVPITPSSLSRPPQRQPRSRPLSTDREISTIPRAITDSSAHLNSAEKAALPSNAEKDTGHDKQSGNWIYPSQEMFYAAMKRKGHDPAGGDMASVVPIHNAVNERAWAEIKQWEEGRGSEECGGPKLVSFAGDSKALTPRARWKIFTGYERPFDRHDWVVDRCGKKVEYVIDFYAGKSESGIKGKGLNFYLDVRPKLNSWEGIMTRVGRSIGF